MKISVLTPTYNRGELLERLYESLEKNSIYGVEIEWSIMNDGSTDKTKEIVQKFQEKNVPNLEIKYFEQDNQGKMVAINNLVEHVTGEYMIDCDSDDYFADNAFKYMKQKIEESKQEKNIYGLCFLKFDIKGVNLGKVFTKKRSTLFDLHFKENDQGERAILFISSIRKKYKHKLENGEKFVTEARMYYEMDKENELLCFNLPIMICEYQEKGYTVRDLCPLVHIARSSYYKWLNHPKSSHELANEKISAAIQEIYKEHPDKGHRRIRDDLEKDYDIQVSPKLGTEVGPVFPPRLCDFGVFIVPVLREGLQIVQSSLLVHCSMVSLICPRHP